MTLSQHHVDGDTFVIARTFRAAPDAVFAAFTDPAQLARWWGPQGITNTEVTFDARPGGAWRIAMRLPDGAVYPLHGTVVSLEHPRELVLAMHTDEHPPAWHAAFAAAAGRPVGAPIVIHTAISFAPVAEGTRVTVRQRFTSPADAAANAALGAPAGWGGSFVRLDTVLAIVAPHAETLTLDRVVRAKRPAVFAAFTSARALDAWWGPDGFVTQTASLAFEVGGEWRFTMTHPTYGRFQNRVRYTDIAAPERIAWDHDDGEGGHAFSAEVWLEDLGEQTRVTLRHVHVSAEARARVAASGAIEGGKQTLGRLAAFVEST